MIQCVRVVDVYIESKKIKARMIKQSIIKRDDGYFS